MSDRPRLESLRAFLDTLFKNRGDDVAFVVLYGSMARGDWSRNSDFDVLVGLTRDPEPRFMDRLGAFLDLSEDGQVEALPYTLVEIETMFRHFNLVILAALRDGIVLADNGSWLDYLQRFHHLLDRGLLQDLGRAWSWTEEAEQLMTSTGVA